MYFCQPSSINFSSGMSGVIVMSSTTKKGVIVLLSMTLGILQDNITLLWAFFGTPDAPVIEQKFQNSSTLGEKAKPHSLFSDFWTLWSLKPGRLETYIKWDLGLNYRFFDILTTG
jgi:hypothetical protein